jgi:hypothetical protein
MIAAFSSAVKCRRDFPVGRLLDSSSPPCGGLGVAFQLRQNTGCWRIRLGRGSRSITGGHHAQPVGPHNIANHLRPPCHATRRGAAAGKVLRALLRANDPGGRRVHLPARGHAGHRNAGSPRSYQQDARSARSAGRRNPAARPGHPPWYALSRLKRSRAASRWAAWLKRRQAETAGVPTSYRCCCVAT